MVFKSALRQLVRFCLFVCCIGLLPWSNGVVMAASEKGLIVVDKDDFRLRLAKDVYYLVDPEGTATLDDIREASTRGAFSRFRNDTLQFGYSNHTYWLKFTVENQLKERVGEAPADRFYLTVRYPLLDSSSNG